MVWRLMRLNRKFSQHCTNATWLHWTWHTVRSIISELHKTICSCFINECPVGTEFQRNEMRNIIKIAHSPGHHCGASQEAAPTQICFCHENVTSSPLLSPNIRWNKIYRNEYVFVLGNWFDNFFVRLFVE